MNKYALMLSAAALIAAAPIYYAVNAQAEDAASDAPVEITIDCTKAALNGEEIPAECEPVDDSAAADVEAASDAAQQEQESAE